jgi:hypothetical protein
VWGGRCCSGEGLFVFPLVLLYMVISLTVFRGWR